MSRSNIISVLTSVRFTLLCLALAMSVVFVGTMAQANMGTFAAQKIYFNQFFVYGPEIGGLRIPVLPGGLTVGLLWFINLSSVMLFRLRFTLKNAGLVCSHSGLLILLLGQFLTQQRAHESRLVFEEGETRHYIESSSDVELAVVMTSEADRDELTSVPVSYVRKGGFIRLPSLPFTLDVKRFFPNAFIQRKADNESSPITHGVGTQLSIQELPVTTRDDEMNSVSAIVEVKEGANTLGTWLVSTALGAPQSFSSQGKTYGLFLRPKRFYLPYSLTLKDFRHDIYPGTAIPKNFSSLVQLENQRKREKRDVLISMNNPLRYEGLTFYQASFGKNDTLSVLQVVLNPAWLTPYLSCAMVVLGLAVHFLIRMTSKPRRSP